MLTACGITLNTTSYSRVLCLTPAQRSTQQEGSRYTEALKYYFSLRVIKLRKERRSGSSDDEI
jgi:hypothetical protein